MNTFFLKVISSDKVFYEGKCQNLILPIEDGQFSVLAHHENMVVAVENGELHLKTPEGEWITAAVSQGFAEIINNRVSVLVNSASAPRRPAREPRNACAISRVSRNITCLRPPWPAP